MKIALNTQEEMIEMAGYFLPSSEYDFLTDFDRYCYSRDLIKEWNSLPLDQRIHKSYQIEVYGFNVKTPVWK
jgi:hypothetical protein